MWFGNTTQFAVVDQLSTSGRLIVHPPVSVTSVFGSSRCMWTVLLVFDRKKKKRQLKFGYCRNEVHSLPDYSRWVTPTFPSRRARCRKIRVARQISVSYELTSTRLPPLYAVAKKAFERLGFLDITHARLFSFFLFLSLYLDY